MQGIYSVLLLIVSNIFMTFAWYGHLKLQEMKLISNWPFPFLFIAESFYLWNVCKRTFRFSAGIDYTDF